MPFLRDKLAGIRLMFTLILRDELAGIRLMTVKSNKLLF